MRHSGRADAAPPRSSYRLLQGLRKARALAFCTRQGPAASGRGLFSCPVAAALQRVQAWIRISSPSWHRCVGHRDPRAGHCAGYPQFIALGMGRWHRNRRRGGDGSGRLGACHGGRDAELLVGSQPIFLALKMLGAAYLVFLGVQGIRAALGPPELFGGRITDGWSAARPMRSFRQGIINDLGNPKMAAFFTSLLRSLRPSMAGRLSR